MAKVKMLSRLTCPTRGVVQPGQIHTTTDEQAADLVARGYAEPVASDAPDRSADVPESDPSKVHTKPPPAKLPDPAPATPAGDAPPAAASAPAAKTTKEPKAPKAPKAKKGAA